MTGIGNKLNNISPVNPLTKKYSKSTENDKKLPNLSNPLPFQNFSSKLQLSYPKGSSMEKFSIFDNEVPVVTWTQKDQLKIVNSFKQGLKDFHTTPEELSKIIKDFGLGNMEINENNIQSPLFAKEIMKIQEQLNTFMDTPDAQKFGIVKNIKMDGQLNKATIQALIGLKDSNRGEPVYIDIATVKQIGHTACYLTSEAMYFNSQHGKLGKDDAYTEFDLRKRVNSGDRIASGKSTSILSESASGRISIKRQSGINLVNFIDNELNSSTPKPVVIGVSSRKQEAGKEYNEGITDHFVLLTGRGYDEQGLYYTFNDPFSGGKDDKFRFDSLTGKMYGFGDQGRKYDVTVANSYDIKPEKSEYYSKIGKPLFNIGSKGTEIAKLQTKLNLIGFSNIPANGKLDSKFSAVVKDIQNRFSLPATGNIDSYTFSAINTSFTSYQKSNIFKIEFKAGDTSALISDIQDKLAKAGYKTGKIRGKFTPETEKAVSEFQKNNNLNVTGKIDNHIWLKIQELQ